MSLLILFTSRREDSSGGSGVGRDRGYAYGYFHKYKPPVVFRAKPKRKRRVSALNRDEVLATSEFREAVKGLARAKRPEDLKVDYALGSKEIVESWRQLLKPQSLKDLQKALESLSPLSEKEAETVVEIVAPEVFEVVEERPKVLEFSDEELILAATLVRDKLTPRPKLEFTDEELILAAFLIKQKRKRK